MLRNTAGILLGLTLWFAVVRCEKTVFFDVDTQENMLVVSAVVQADTSLEVHVTLSIDPLSIGFDPEEVSDAQVSIYRNGNFIAFMNHTIEGYYYLDKDVLQAAAGDVIKVEVAAEGHTTAYAETVIPQEVSIEQVSILDTIFFPVSYSVIDSFGNYYVIDTVVPHYQLAIDFTDIPGDDFYSLEITYTDAFSETYTCFSTSDAAFVLNGDFNLGGTNDDGTITLCNEAYFNDISFAGEHKRLIVSLLEIPTEFVVDPQFIIELNHISTGYYTYLTTSNLQNTNGDNPFSEPVIIYNNIENGFGILGAVSTSTYVLDL